MARELAARSWPLRGLAPVLLALLAQTALLCGVAEAASAWPQCRGAGMPADAPLFYLELMPCDDAGEAREPEKAGPGQVARRTAGMGRTGRPGARMGVEEAAARREELEIVAVLPLEPERLAAAHKKREGWPRQQQLESAYRGETRNVVPTDLNHDGIMDFILNEDPHLDMWAAALFLGCGDNFYTPLGFFSASYSAASGPAVTVEQGGIAGRVWDVFRVVAPDLPEGRQGFREPGRESRRKERVIAFDPARGVYREISARPLP